MRTITRSKYTPKTGDYHDMIVHDPAWGKIWLFDCDGVFLDMSKTNVIVVNEPGESETFAISQKFVTDQINRLDADIIEVDENSQIRDGALEGELDLAVETLGGRIDTVNTDAIYRETQLANTLNAHINALDNDIETLTLTTNNLTSLINTINQTAVFGVTLTQGENIVLSVTDGSVTTTSTIREANATRNGLMSMAAYNQITENTEAIRHLQNAGLYRGSFDTLADAPTATPDARFIGGEAFPNDFVAIQHATYEGETGIARYRIAVNEGAVTYNFEAFIDKDIQNFTAGNPGLIVGGSSDGEIEAQANGVGDVVGWSALKGRVSDAEGSITSLDGRMTTAEGDIDNLENGLATTNGNLATAQNNIQTNAGNIAANTSAISGNTSAIGTINGKAVEATTMTTIGANAEPLLTVNGMMNHWVDITNTGLPANPDANTFYYVVES